VQVPHIPTPLEELGQRPFSFYPAILNIEHNEWLFRRAHPDEIQVINTKSREELWIPRRFLGGVSSAEEPVVIVGLIKELEYKEGVVVPHIRRVIEMRRAVNESVRSPARPPEPGRLAPVVGIRLESEPEQQKGRKLLGTVAAGLLTCVVAMVAFRAGPLYTRSRLFAPPSQLDLPFTAADDYFSVVEKLGHPDASRSLPWPRERNAGAAANGLEIYFLRYPDRALTIVLGGAGREHATYLGALSHGRVVHSVRLPSGQDSAAILSNIR
jgi:hypothetical protein